VGRVVDEVDAEEEWAVMLDGWIPWEEEDRVAGRAAPSAGAFAPLFFSIVLRLFVVQGRHDERTTHSATLRWRIFLCLLATLSTNCW
jgi:hypothetical protein